VLSTDGVGTKLLVADEAGRYDTVGIDLVAMVVNDIVVTGARPISFLDYYAVERLEKDKSRQIISGIVEGCKIAGCELTGGETAELPGIYPRGGYDLAGFAVGVVDKREVIDGSKVKPGDVVVGLASSGLHSNGFSLARKALMNKRKFRGVEYRRVLELMLTPTAIYVQPVLKLIRKVKVKALAHITGGGIAGNLVRVMPPGAKAVINAQLWEAPEIFHLIYERGPVEELEMFRVFNMGIGMCAVVAEKDMEKTISMLRRNGVHAMQIGRIEKGRQSVVVEGLRNGLKLKA
jgi:phosphoribosylformylglycinamidine cyclo-ligase